MTNKHFLMSKYTVHGQRSLAGYSLWGCKESDMAEHILTLSILKRGKTK